MMAEPTTAGPEPDNNNCPKHDYFNLTCGTCNGLFDAEGNDLADIRPNTTTKAVKSAQSAIEDKLNEIISPSAYGFEDYDECPECMFNFKRAKQDIQAIITTETTKTVQETYETIMEVAGEYRGKGMLADFVNVDDLGRVSLDRLHALTQKMRDVVTNEYMDSPEFYENLKKRGKA